MLATLSLLIYAILTVALGLLVAVFGIRHLDDRDLEDLATHPFEPKASPFVGRLNQAHTNAILNLPLFAVVVLLEIQFPSQTGLFGLIALGMVLARFAGAVLHLVSSAPWAGTARLAFYLVEQVAIAVMVADIVLGLMEVTL